MGLCTLLQCQPAKLIITMQDYPLIQQRLLMKLLAGRSQDLADVSRMLGGATEVQLEEVRAVINQYLSNAVEDLESLIMLGRLEHE